jgi:predicted AAA+ superfamily ATPase
LNKYRFLKRFLPKEARGKIVLLTGARQTGKTTLIQEQYTKLKYINLDAPENRELVRMISSSAWARDMGEVIIDEAQKEPVVFEKIKYAFDAKQINGSVLLGSSQILLLKKIRESLAGRVSMYELWPLLLSELSQPADAEIEPNPLVDELFSDQPLDDLFSALPSVLHSGIEDRYREAEAYLSLWGGMPSLLPLAEEGRWKWLRDYEYTYLERDLSDLARLDDLQPFRKFQKLTALRAAQLLNYSEIARDAGVSVDTARRYLEYLNLSYQVILLQPYYKNLTSSVVKTPKVYWTDIGILRQLTGNRGEISGALYENMVASEMTKWIKTAQRDAELYFYRTYSGREVDLILQTNFGIIGLEIKSRGKIVNSDIRPMREIAAKLGKEWRGGLVVYAGKEIKKIGEPHIWTMPFWRLFG